MTSKQAFNIVRCGGLGCTEKEFYKAESIVEKDLEVLEILKPHLKLQNIGTTPKYEIVLVMDENMAGYDRIKEWIINDK